MDMRLLFIFWGLLQFLYLVFYIFIVMVSYLWLSLFLSSMMFSLLLRRKTSGFHKSILHTDTLQNALIRSKTPDGASLAFQVQTYRLQACHSQRKYDGLFLFAPISFTCLSTLAKSPRAILSDEIRCQCLVSCL